MSPDLLKGFFRIGIFVAGAAVFLLFIVDRNSAEYVVTVLSLFIGIALIGCVAFVGWYINR